MRATKTEDNKMKNEMIILIKVLMNNNVEFCVKDNGCYYTVIAASKGIAVDFHKNKNNTQINKYKPIN